MPAFIGIFFWVAVAATAFHAAYASVNTSFLIVVYLFALLRLAQTDRWRRAFYSGFAVGLLIAAVRLAFFWPGSLGARTFLSASSLHVAGRTRMSAPGPA